MGWTYGRHPTELHLFLLLLWNLMARSDTASSVHSRHLDWEGDCLKIGIAKSKRNSSVTATYYNVFANPFQPAVCPVLGLAIHLACNTNILGPTKFASRGNSNAC